MRPRLAHRLLVSLALSTSCTHAGAPSAQSAPTSPAQPSLAQADVYATEPLPDAVRGAGADAILASALERGCKAAHLTPDGRLADIATAIAIASDGARRPPSYGQVSFHAHRAGLPEPTPQVWLASGPDTRTLAPLMEQAMRDAVRTSRLTHCGAAAVRGREGVVVALALSTRVFSLVEPVPRSLSPGSALVLAAQLASGYGRPVLAVTDPAGRVTRSTLGDKRRFRREVRLEQPGEYTIELLASGPEGLTVAAMFPVAVGVPIVTEAPSYEREPIERDAPEVARKLLALIAEERSAHGLPPLRGEPRLERIALAHSEDMVSHGFIAHTSPRTGDATARVRRAGLDAYVVLENIGRGYSATELHRGLMESPGHRGNILHPEAREIGIGVVAEREGERLAFIATELFTQLAH